MKKISFNFYKTICITTSIVFLYSFFQHLFNSDSIINDLGLQSSSATKYLAHRLSIFPLGLAILLFLQRNLIHNKVRQNFCISMSILLLAYAGIGCYELIEGNINSYILVAIFLEILLGGSFSAIYFKNMKKRAVSHFDQR